MLDHRACLRRARRRGRRPGTRRPAPRATDTASPDRWRAGRRSDAATSATDRSAASASRWRRASRARRSSTVNERTAQAWPGSSRIDARIWCESVGGRLLTGVVLFLDACGPRGFPRPVRPRRSRCRTGSRSSRVRSRTSAPRRACSRCRWGQRGRLTGAGDRRGAVTLSGSARTTPLRRALTSSGAGASAPGSSDMGQRYSPRLLGSVAIPAVCTWFTTAPPGRRANEGKVHMKRVYWGIAGAAAWSSALDQVLGSVVRAAARANGVSTGGDASVKVEGKDLSGSGSQVRDVRQAGRQVRRRQRSGRRSTGSWRRHDGREPPGGRVREPGRRRHRARRRPDGRREDRIGRRRRSTAAPTRSPVRPGRRHEEPDGGHDHEEVRDQGDLQLTGSTRGRRTCIARPPPSALASPALLLTSAGTDL